MFDIRRFPERAREFPDETMPKTAHKVKVRPVITGREAGLGHAHFCSMCRSNFCSMKITQDVRKYAEEHGLTEDEALQQGLEQKAVEFVTSGAEIYKKA